MKRALENYIIKDLPSKIVLLMGPRQAGKTTLAKQLYPNYQYINFDSAEDRLLLSEKSWDRKSQLVIFDELHKMKEWKRWMKGVYDTEGIPPEYLVTGSARMDIHRKVGDSLAGRYFQYRLHPLDLKEARHHLDEKPDDLFQRLWTCSGFPEPFLKGSEQYYKRWRRSHLDIILRQDLIDLYNVRDIQSIETLVELLKQRIGSTVSYANLARDLDRDPTTIKRWLSLLENLYIIYRVTPFANKIARSLQKEPKFYFYDHTYADNNHGGRLENIVANALLKELHFIEDTTGSKTQLHFLRTKDHTEIDFLVMIDNKPCHLIEVKTKDNDPSPAFKHFAPHFPEANLLQVVLKIEREKTFHHGLEIRSLIPWLASLNLSASG